MGMPGCGECCAAAAARTNPCRHLQVTDIFRIVIHEFKSEACVLHPSIRRMSAPCPLCCTLAPHQRARWAKGPISVFPLWVAGEETPTEPYVPERHTSRDNRLFAFTVCSTSTNRPSHASGTRSCGSSRITMTAGLLV